MLPLSLKPFGAIYPFSPTANDKVFAFIDAMSDAIADIALDVSGQFAMPLRVTSISSDGSGKINVLIISDANDAVVFDSTICASNTTYWNSDYYVIEWVNTSDADAGSEPDDDTADPDHDTRYVCRLVGRQAVPIDISTSQVVIGMVTHTIFTVTISYLSPNVRPTYSDGVIGDAALILDPMTTTFRPARVDSIAVNDQVGQTGVVNIAPGYSAAWRSVAAPLQVGQIQQSKVYVDLTGGGGLGFPLDCTASDPLLRFLGGVGGDKYGGLRLSATDCYSVYVSSPIVNNVAEPPAATLNMRNDCQPCYKCSAFEAVYNAMRVMSSKFMILGQRGDAVNQKYNTMRSRWLDQKACRESKPVRVLLLSSDAGGGNTWVTAVVTFGNSSGTCLGQIGVNMRWSVSAGVGAPSLDYTQTRRYLAQAGRPQPYSLGGVWPNYTADWDFVPAGNAVRIKAVFLFPAVAAGSWVQLTATPVINGVSGTPDQSWTDTIVLGIPS